MIFGMRIDDKTFLINRTFVLSTELFCALDILWIFSIGCEWIPAWWTVASIWSFSILKKSSNIHVMKEGSKWGIGRKFRTLNVCVLLPRQGLNQISHHKNVSKETHSKLNLKTRSGTDWSHSDRKIIQSASLKSNLTIKKWTK